MLHESEYIPCANAQAGYSPLEVRLEASKCLNDARQDFINPLDDGRSIAERYLAGDVHLHLHMAIGGMFCATHDAVNPHKVSFKAVPKGDLAEAEVLNEFAVFVKVGAVSEATRPILHLTKMFACPSDSFEAIIERVKMIVGHLVVSRYDRCHVQGH
jgi:hypothetical protein